MLVTKTAALRGEAFYRSPGPKVHVDNTFLGYRQGK